MTPLQHAASTGPASAWHRLVLEMLSVSALGKVCALWTAEHHCATHSGVICNCPTKTHHIWSDRRDCFAILHRSVAALPTVPAWAAGAVAVYSALVALNVFWLGLLLRIAARRASSGSRLQQQPSLKLDQCPPSATTMGPSVAGGEP